MQTALNLVYIIQHALQSIVDAVVDRFMSIITRVFMATICRSNIVNVLFQLWDVSWLERGIEFLVVLFHCYVLFHPGLLLY